MNRPIAALAAALCIVGAGGCASGSTPSVPATAGSIPKPTSIAVPGVTITRSQPSPNEACDTRGLRDPGALRIANHLYRQHRGTWGKRMQVCGQVWVFVKHGVSKRATERELRRAGIAPDAFEAKRERFTFRQLRVYHDRLSERTRGIDRNPPLGLVGSGPDYAIQSVTVDGQVLDPEVLEVLGSMGEHFPPIVYYVNERNKPGTVSAPMVTAPNATGSGPSGQLPASNSSSAS